MTPESGPQDGGETVDTGESKLAIWQRKIAIGLFPPGEEIMHEVMKRVLETICGSSQIEDERMQSVQDARKGYTAPEGSDMESAREVILAILSSFVVRPMDAEGIKMQHLDEKLFGMRLYDIPASVEKEHIALRRLGDYTTGLGIMLYERFGKEIADLAYMLVTIGSSYRADVHPLKGACRAAKGDSICETLDAAIPISDIHDGKKVAIINWVLGAKLCEELGEGCREDVGKILDNFKKRFDADENFGAGLYSVLCYLRGLPDRLVIQAYVRQGIMALFDAVEVTNWEFCEKQRRANELAENRLGKMADGDASLQQSKKVVARYLETHTEPEIPGKLIDVIDCERLKQELAKARESGNVNLYRNKCKEIIYRILSAMMNYSFVGTEEKRLPAWRRGFPQHVIEHKEYSCFSAPWLALSLLMKCGIRYEDVLYCHVYKTHNNMAGSHGTLLIHIGGGEYHFVDPAYHPQATPAPTVIFTCEEREALEKLFNGERTKYLPISLDESVSNGTKVHQEMGIMPLIAGLTSGHLLHVGINFLNEDRIDEALETFRVAKETFPFNVDTLYYTAVALMRKKLWRDAEIILKHGLDIISAHPQCHYGLGLVYMRIGKMGKAKWHFFEAAKYGGNSYDCKQLVKDARRFARMPCSTLREMTEVADEPLPHLSDLPQT